MANSPPTAPGTRRCTTRSSSPTRTVAPPVSALLEDDLVVHRLVPGAVDGELAISHVERAPGPVAVVVQHVHDTDFPPRDGERRLDRLQQDRPLAVLQHFLLRLEILEAGVATAAH